MSRKFCIPGVVFLLAATVLSIIAAISVPYFSAVDIARVHFKGSAAGGSDTSEAISQIRFGVWGFCAYELNSSDRTCSHSGNAYQVTLGSPNANSNVIIGSSWTRGLAVHPVAAGVTFLALLASLSTHLTVQLVASVLSFLASLLTLIAFAIDIALYAYVKHQAKKLQGARSDTDTGVGFWLTFVAFILTLLAGCTVCFGRRRERMYGATTYPSTDPEAGTTTTTTGRRPGFFGRFRKY
jgi:hypothetical protein